jgi:hypothetical protein
MRCISQAPNETLWSPLSGPERKTQDKLVAREEDLRTHRADVFINQEQVGWQAPAVDLRRIMAILPKHPARTSFAAWTSSCIAVVKNISSWPPRHHRTGCNKARILKDHVLNLCGQVHKSKRGAILPSSW